MHKTNYLEKKIQMFWDEPIAKINSVCVYSLPTIYYHADSKFYGQCKQAAINVFAVLMKCTLSDLQCCSMRKS